MSNNNLVSVQECDYLDADPPLRGQNYVCLSFVSPEDVVVQKEHYFFSKFIENFTSEMNEMFTGLSERYPKDVDNLRMLKERYSYLFDDTLVGEEYSFFVANHSEELQKAFDEKNNFKTSIRGLKVRGVFDSMREAQIRAEVLKKLDGKFNVYVAEVGVWCPWSPNPEEIQNQEFAESHLNTMMKHYKDNQTKKDIFYEERKRELQFLKVKKDIETDTWADRKDEEAGPSTSNVQSDDALESVDVAAEDVVPVEAVVEDAVPVEVLVEDVVPLEAVVEDAVPVEVLVEDVVPLEAV
jgi:hypothetical protein